ncbi:MAG: hypothetical protein ACI4F6_00545 [Acutalibacteraceae bacterium]
MIITDGELSGSPFCLYYDISDIRTQKNVDGTVTKYYYDDSNNLVSMTVGDKTLMFFSCVCNLR